MGYRDPTYYNYTSGENPDSLESLTKRVDALEEGGGSGGTTDYNKLKNKPSINGEVLVGDVTVEGTKDYNALDNKPSINSVELAGNKTQSDLHISGSAPSVVGETMVFT